MFDTKLKIYLETLGCQMNLYDSELLREALTECGHEFTDDRFSADVVLYNTCSVREKAEEKIYSRLGELKVALKKNPDMIIGVLGCMAQREGKKIFGRAPMVKLVVGTKRFLDIPELIEEVLHKQEHILATEEDVEISINRHITRRDNPYQAYLAIMRGCNNFCSYCVVPYVRGRETSRPDTNIIEEARKLVDDGVVELTLLGQNVNSYNGGKGGFPGLLKNMAKIEGLKRLKFVTNHPKDFSEEVARTIAESDVICEYLHLPAQSGSNRILKEMNRGYTKEHYLGLIDMAKKIIPNIEIASDFILGFPGETDEDFEQTRQLLEKVRYQNSFIFRYSPRPNTKASLMPDDVPTKVKAERNAILIELQKRISEEKNQELIGQTVEVLFEGQSKSNPETITGRTRTNRIALIKDPGVNLAGKILPVKVVSATPLTIFCELFPSE